MPRAGCPASVFQDGSTQPTACSTRLVSDERPALLLARLPGTLQTWQQMRWGVGWPSQDPGVFPLMSQRNTGPLGGLQPEPTPCRPQQQESCKEGQWCGVSWGAGRGAQWHRAGVSGPEQDAMGNVCLGGLGGISVDETVTQALGHQTVLGLLLEEGP